MKAKGEDKTMIVEKRFHTRLETHIDSHILYRGRHITATTKDITPYGALLSTDRLSVPNGMLLKLSIEVGGRSEVVSGLVVWSRQQKIGIMFQQIQYDIFTAAESTAVNPGNSKQNSSHNSPSVTPKHVLFQPEPGMHR
jgi:hypothetical protein